jgi:hypothetical protein
VLTFFAADSAKGQAGTQQVPTTMICMPAPAMMSTLEKLNEKIVGGGVSGPDKRVGLFVDKTDNSWSIIISLDNQGVACAIAGGQGWRSEKVGKPQGNPL